MNTPQSIPELEARLRRLIRLSMWLCFLAMVAASFSIAIPFLFGRGEC